MGTLIDKTTICLVLPSADYIALVRIVAADKPYIRKELT